MKSSVIKLLFQPAGDGETLGIAITNKNEEDARVIWLLDDSYSRDGKWARGQVEVKAVEITDEFEYRVNIDIFFL